MLRGLLNSVETGKVDHGFGEGIVEWDVPVGVVLFGEGFEAERFQVVEGGQAQGRGLGEGLVVEGGEDVFILRAVEAVGGGYGGVDGGAKGPAGVVAFEDGPGVFGLGLSPDVGEL